jgi:uncharacterized membrane protein YbhN (UPF0104 family)
VKSLTAINFSARFKLLIKLILTGLALVVVLNKISITDTLRVLQKTNLWVMLIAVLLYNLSQFISANRLRLFLQSLHIPVSATTNFRLYYRGMFYNLFLPGGIGGDAYKMLDIHRHTNIPVKKIFSALLADRANGAVALLILVLLITMAVPVIPTPWKYLSPLAAIVILISSMFIVNLLVRQTQAAWNAGLVYSLAVQLTQAAAAVLLFMGIGVQAGNLSVYTATFLLSSLAAALPVTVGGLGARELTFVWTASYFPDALHTEKAIAFTMIFFLINAVSALAGAFLKTKWEETAGSAAGNSTEPVMLPQPNLNDS